MRTRIEIAPDRCDLSHGLLQARRLRPSADGVLRVALVAGQALLLAGDHVEVEVAVTGPICLQVVEPAGTVAYDMRGGSARWEVAVTLRRGAHLVWDSEPFVVASGSEVWRTTSLDVGAGCTARLRETVVLGRHRELGGTLRTSTRAELDGSPALVEQLVLGPSSQAGWAGLGGHRVFDSLTMLGARLAHDEHTLQLEAPGSVARWLGTATHLSPLGRTAVVDSLESPAGEAVPGSGQCGRRHETGPRPGVGLPGTSEEITRWS